jgi:hypothetical protein
MGIENEVPNGFIIIFFLKRDSKIQKTTFCWVCPKKSQGIGDPNCWRLHGSPGASRSQAHPRSEELQLQRNWWLKQRKALMQDVATDMATDVATGAARTVGFCKKCFLYPLKRKCGFVLDGKQKGAHIVPFFHCSAYSF